MNINTNLEIFAREQTRPFLQVAGGCIWLGLYVGVLPCLLYMEISRLCA